MAILSVDLQALQRLQDKMVTIVVLDTTHDNRNVTGVKLGFSNGTWLEVGDIGEGYWGIKENQ